MAAGMATIWHETSTECLLMFFSFIPLRGSCLSGAAAGKMRQTVCHHLLSVLLARDDWTPRECAKEGVSHSNSLARLGHPSCSIFHLLFPHAQHINFGRSHPPRKIIPKRPLGIPRMNFAEFPGSAFFLAFLY